MPKINPNMILKYSSYITENTASTFRRKPDNAVYSEDHTGWA